MATDIILRYVRKEQLKTVLELLHNSVFLKNTK